MESETSYSKLYDMMCDASTDLFESPLPSFWRNTTKISLEEVLRVKKIEPSKLDKWYKYILELNYFEIVGLASSVNEDENQSVVRLSKVPMSFESPQQYFSIFHPLFMEEFKEQMRSSFREIRYAWDTMYHGTLSMVNWEKSTEMFHFVEFVHNDDNESTPFKNLYKNDLVLLTKQPPHNDSCNDVHIIGKVEAFGRQYYDDEKRSICKVKISLCFCETNSRLRQAKAEMHKPDVEWHASCIMNITPQLRGFLALSSLQSFDSSIHSAILKPYDGCNKLDHEAALSNIPEPLQNVIRASFNDSQLQAIGASIGLPNSKGFHLSLIQGPPGTGKTQTIMGIVSCLLASSQGHAESTSENEDRLEMEPNEDDRSLLRTRRVLICAQSNAAVDELVSRICSAGLYGDDGEMYMPYIVRAGKAETTHPNSMCFFIDTLVDQCLAQEIMHLGLANNNESIIYFCMTLLQNMKELEEQIEKYKIKRIKTIPTGVGIKEMSDSDSAKRIIKDISAAQARNEEVDKKINALKHMLRRAILQQADIVLATLNGCGGDVDRYCDVIETTESNIRFDAVVIDEAAQALEPATLIPMQLLKRDGPKCIMVGDPKQLPATVLSKVASKFLYGRSMFERLQRAGHPVTLLTKQYRMHPEISQFPSLRFYNGKLQNGENMSTKIAPFHESDGLGPYLFFDVVEGKELRGNSSGGFSLCNEQEAQAAVEHLMFFKKRYCHILHFIKFLYPREMQGPRTRNLKQTVTST
ncbi:uncharacterized ATP-dependent helicase C29A10.10c-like [Mercurialis annua]|uniref:uncharacterized ATP-dependent helicase C29A10.10c-like n=1 Tax=Mercurialis annua TaxID=3986 RepID=UPI0024AFA851|nr:uncharacterized ATP-dependent helicase C29A10.10c-like [Mercurialis annua]